MWQVWVGDELWTELSVSQHAIDFAGYLRTYCGKRNVKIRKGGGA